MIDPANPAMPEQVVEAGLDRRPVGQHVRHARGHAKVVLQHHETVARADQVGPAESDVDPLRNRDPAHLDTILGAAVDHVRGDDPVGEYPPAPVDVGQEQVQRLEPLAQPALDEVPGIGIDDSRQHVDGDDALLGALLAVDREGDSLLQEGPFGAFLHGGDLFGNHAVENVPELAAVVARRTVGLEHFVVEARVRGVIGKERTVRLLAAGSGRVLPFGVSGALRHCRWPPGTIPGDSGADAACSGRPWFAGAGGIRTLEKDIN